jgi:hypothetical protein
LSLKANLPHPALATYNCFMLFARVIIYKAENTIVFIDCIAVRKKYKGK